MRLAHPIARPSLGALGSVSAHLLAAMVLAYFGRDPCAIAETQCLADGGEPAACRAAYDTCKGIEPTYDLVQFDLPEPEPEPEPETPPEPEKPPEPEPEPEPEPIVQPTPPTKVQTPRQDRVKPAPVAKNPTPDEPPPLFRVDPSQAVDNGSSGVKVNVGTPGGTPGGTGDANSKGKGSRPADAQVGTSSAPAWEPRGELYIRDLPRVLNVPQDQCPAVQELGIEGTVILTVQVRRDGSVKDVKVVKDIGHGCGKVAAKALRRAKFKPAVATNGQPADFELRYEYEFQLGD